MFETCRHARLALDIHTQRLGWNAHIPDQREGVNGQAVQQLDTDQDSTWFKVQSSHLYKHPSIVLVEDLVHRDDVVKDAVNQPKKVANLPQTRNLNRIYCDKSNEQSKSNKNGQQPVFSHVNSDQDQRIHTTGYLKTKPLKDWNNGQNQVIRNNKVTTENQCIVRNTKKQNSSTAAQSLTKDKQVKRDTQSSVHSSLATKKQTSEKQKTKQTSFVKHPGVRRRMELDAESFFEFLFSNRWEEGCLVRVLSGKLLDSLLHCLTRLEKFHDVISFATMAYLYHKKPVLPCIQTATEKTEYELIEERVLVEFDYFYPQERPEIIKQQLETMGGLFSTEDLSDIVEKEQQSDVNETPHPFLSPDSRPSAELSLTCPAPGILGDKQLGDNNYVAFSQDDENLQRNISSSDQNSVSSGTLQNEGAQNQCKTKHVNSHYTPSSGKYINSTEGHNSSPKLSVSVSQAGDMNHPSKNSAFKLPLINGATLHATGSHRDTITSEMVRQQEALNSRQLSSFAAEELDIASTGTEIASFMAEHRPSASLSHAENHKFESSIPDLPPINKAKLAISSSRSSGGSLTLAQSVNSLKSMTNTSNHGSRGSGTTENAKSTSSIHLPSLRCNIRGLVQPPAHEQCLRPYHMVREPFLRRRNRQQSAFPRISLPELPLKISLDEDVVTEDQDSFWVLKDENHLGKILGDATELVASTISLPSIPAPTESEIQSFRASKLPVSRFAKELASKKREKPNRSTNGSLDGSGTDEEEEHDFEKEEKELKCYLDPVRKDTFLQDVNMMRKELTVTKAISKTVKVNVHEILKMDVRNKQHSKQIDCSEEGRPKPAREAIKKLKKHPQPQGGLFVSPTPRASPTSTIVSSNVSSLSYKQAPMPVPPFNFFKKWNKTPDFYEFYMYLKTGTFMNRDDLIAMEPKRSVNSRLKGQLRKNMEESKQTVKSGQTDESGQTEESGQSKESRQTEKSNKKKQIKDVDKLLVRVSISALHRTSSASLTCMGERRKKNEAKKHDLQDDRDDCLKMIKKTVMDKYESFDKMHAFTRIQIATAETKNVKKVRSKSSASFLLSKLSSEEMLRRAHLGLTMSGTHLLTGEQEKLLENEEFIFSSMDPWHISALFAYLTGGVCDSVRVRNDLLQRRQRIVTLLEQSKQIVEQNEARVKSRLNFLTKPQKKPSKVEMETVTEEKGKTEESPSADKQKEKAKKGKRLSKFVGVIIKDDEDHKITTELRRKSEKKEAPKAKCKQSKESFQESFHEKDHKGTKPETIKEENKETNKKTKTSKQDISEEAQKKDDDTAKKESQKTAASKEVSLPTDKKKTARRKREPCVYISDSEVPNSITPDRLFKLMQVDKTFDPTKLHSAYSFEKMFSHRKQEIPKYKKRLKEYEKPFKKKKKKKDDSQSKRKRKETKETEEASIVEEEPVDEASLEVPFVLGRMKEFKFLQYRDYIPEPVQTEEERRGEMTTEQICQNMVMAMQMFVVRKERATTTFGTCQYQSKVSVTFTKRAPGDAWLGVPPLGDTRRMVAAVCHTLKSL